MEICFIPQNFDGSGCYRCLFPADMLSQKGGHHTFMPQFVKRGEDELSVDIEWQLDVFPMDADLYVFQMPLHPVWYNIIRQVKKAGGKVVVEIDDDLTNLDSSNPAERGTRPAIGKRRKDGDRTVLYRCLGLADAVTVATPALDVAYRKFTKAPFYILRNYLDWRMWDNVRPAYERPNPRGRVRVGYVGALKWHRADVEFLNGWFVDWLLSHPDVDFVAAGDPGIHDYLGTPERQRISTCTVSFRHLELPDIVATFDIGLVPLASSVFNEGKSHLKGMEYAGAGIPSVCSPTESYRYWFHGGGAAGGTGFLGDGHDQWVSILDRLAADGELRRRMGMAGRAVAEQNSIQNNWREWERAYSEVCGIDSEPPRPRKSIEDLITKR